MSKNKILIFALLIILVTCIYIHISVNTYENLAIEPINSDYIIIISHFNEDLSYLNEEPFSKFNQKIYSKGINKPTCNQCNDIDNLPNVGVCVHTYLYYIITNYDSLPNIVIFLPGSCMDEHKKEQTLKTIEYVENTNDSVFIASKLDDNILTVFNDFTLDDYTLANFNNKLLNQTTKLNNCGIRPFGKWYKELFPDISINFTTYKGIFAVSKTHIKSRTKESYENLISYVNKYENSECGHYFERAFLSVFHPIPNKCIYS